jgi:glycosyltransferase involved in cell wall biosynthesis
MANDITGVARNPPAGGTPPHGERRRCRIAYLVSHPIQYQAPLLRLLSAQPDIDLTVFFQSNLSVKDYHDPGFGRTIQWDTPLLSGYRHEFLPAIGSRASVEGHRPFNYGVATRLWRGNFDILWVHSYARWFNWVAILAARIASIPVFVRDEATPISQRRSPRKARLKRIFFRVLDRFCRGFLAISTLNRQYYLENGIDPKRIFFVPYCVDNTYFADLANAAGARREIFRAELGLTPGRPIILYASKLQKRKRADDLLGAFERLIARTDDDKRPYLLFVGDGETRAELEAAATPLGEDVRFLGFRNQSELPALFNLCDVFVLPSALEPFGLIVNEVMNAGRAVIVSSDVGCGPDLVRDGINGYIYPLGETVALAESLEKVLQGPDTVALMGRASAEIIARWNFDRDLEGLRAAIAATMSRRRQGVR